MIGTSEISIKKSILALGFVGALAAISVAVAGALVQSDMSERARRVFVAKDVVADILPPPMYLVELRLVLSQAVEGTLSRSQARARFDALETDYRARVKHWTDHAPDGLETQLLGRQHAAAQRFLDAARAGLIDAPATATATELGQRLAALHPLYEEHRLGVDETVVVGNRFAETAAVEFDRILQFSRALSFGLVVLAALTVFAGYRSVYRQLQRPLQGLADGARRMALGDLAASAGAKRDRHDVIGELESSMEQMRQQLSTLVKAVRVNAFAVATGSTQIARSNDELFKRTEAQAGSLQESASTMSDLCESVRTNADKAVEANRLAAKASEVAAEGGAVVQQMVDLIGRVDESSRRIADIIGVIDGIAFQTNILALNAAVEAARAGDQGRGFAVVASEVRSLAQRSSEAAREVRQLIGTSVQHVSESTALADHAGRTMQAIVGSIGQVTGIVSDISQSSHHQSDVVSVAGQVACLMDESNQRNAASMEESAAAAEELKIQAQQLVQAVAVFKLDEQTSS